MDCSYGLRPAKRVRHTVPAWRARRVSRTIGVHGVQAAALVGDGAGPLVGLGVVDAQHERGFVQARLVQRAAHLLQRFKAIVDGHGRALARETRHALQGPAGAVQPRAREHAQTRVEPLPP